MFGGLEDAIGPVITMGSEEHRGNFQGYRNFVLPQIPSLKERIKGKLKIARRADWSAPGSDKVQQALKLPGVDVALSHFLNTMLPFAKIWSYENPKLFIHCHGYDITWDLESHNGEKRRIHPPDYVERVQELPQSIEFIVNSHESEKRLLEIGLERERIHVKHIGVNVGSVSQQLVAKDRLSLLFLGRLVDCKGPDLTIEAFAQAVSQGLRADLTIAGDGPLMTSCKLLAAHRGVQDKVRFLGAVNSDTALRLMSDCDIFTAHSIKGPLTNQIEAFGVAFLEALACGLPVVTGRSGGIIEIVSNNLDGLLFEPGDIDAHANALLTLANNPELRRFLGKNGREKVVNQFTLSREISQLRNILGLSSKA